MKNLGLQMEYEDILLGKRKDYSAAYMKEEAVQTDIQDLMRYVFENYLHWTPEMVKDYLTIDILKKMHLIRPFKKLDYPAEMNNGIDLSYVAMVLYPKKIRYSRVGLVLHVYEKMLCGEIKKYPKNFFLAADGEENACICLQYALTEYLSAYTISGLYSFFSNKRKAIPFLKRVKLYKPCQDIFELPIDMLHKSLPLEDRDELTYHFERYKVELQREKEVFHL